MFCTNCGKETDEKIRYCKHCNFDLIHIQSLLQDEDIDDDIEDEFREANECAKRCIVLCALKSVAHGDSAKEVTYWLKSENLWSTVSDVEREFFLSDSPTDKQRINASWRVEALSVLLWALGKNIKVDDLSTKCNTDAVDAECCFYLKNTKNFIASATLRDESDIDDLNDLIYDTHWKIRDAQINRKSMTQNFYSGVVIERHHAINWLMGYCGQEWDEVTTDT